MKELLDDRYIRIFHEDLNHNDFLYLEYINSYYGNKHISIAREGDWICRSNCTTWAFDPSDFYYQECDKSDYIWCHGINAK